MLFSDGLPDDAGVLQAMLRVPTRDWRAAWPFVGPKFKLCNDGLLRNARLEAHRERAIELHAKRKRGAAKTNAKRWGRVIPLRSDGDSA